MCVEDYRGACTAHTAYRLAPTPHRQAATSDYSAEDAAVAMAAITEAVAAGELLLGEAESASALVERFVRTIEAGEFEKRLRALEATAAGKR